MANFLGGAVPLVGVAANAIIQNAGATALNVGLNQLLGKETAGQLGLSTLPTNLLQSQITPLITSSLTQGINQAIQTSLKSAGPLGPVLASIATPIVSSLGQKLTNLIANSGGQQQGATISFPGAGGEPEANYGGKRFAGKQSGGTDVVFQILPLTSPAVQEENSTSEVTANVEDFLPLEPDEFDPLAEEIDNKPGTDSNGSPTTQEPGTTTGTGKPGDPMQLPVEPYVPPATPATPPKPEGPAAPAPPTASGWTFTTAPGDVSWTTSSDVDRVKIFGTNAPPVTVGTKGMRDLTLGNALIEGFTMGKTVENKIADLEALMSYTLNNQSGFVSVPVYKVVASMKRYGDGANSVDKGFFVIKEVKVKEVMRDNDGKATRCTVDATFIQIPEYQVDAGRDQASAASAGAKAEGLGPSKTEADAAAQQAAATGTSATGATAATATTSTSPSVASSVASSQSASYAANSAANQGVGVSVATSGASAAVPRPDPLFNAPVVLPSGQVLGGSTQPVTVGSAGDYYQNAQFIDAATGEFIDEGASGDKYREGGALF